jgi:hypothetical protein
MTRDSAARHGAVTRRRISESEISIYEHLDRKDPRFFSLSELEALLGSELTGLSLSFPLRTRAKVAKSAVCRALGYPVPARFRKTRPRFPGQDFDVYVQKNNNLQIWNEEVAPERRYVVIRLDANDVVVAVKVLTGEALAKFDRTGTLTSKYQAKRRDDSLREKPPPYLTSADDTARFRAVLDPRDEIEARLLQAITPDAAPTRGLVLSIRGVTNRLAGLVGARVADAGVDQERLRGAELHRETSRVLGLNGHRDHGQFPDVRCQLVEVKLQTSPTIDLGLVSPDSEAPVDGVAGGLRHCDVRYAVFYGERISSSVVALRDLIVVTGADFFREFRRFGGLVTNRKLQIPLPRNLFDETE